MGKLIYLWGKKEPDWQIFEDLQNEKLCFLHDDYTYNLNVP